jgi:hypothetical protein
MCIYVIEYLSGGHTPRGLTPLTQLWQPSFSLVLSRRASPLASLRDLWRVDGLFSDRFDTEQRTNTSASRSLFGARADIND